MKRWLPLAAAVALSTIPGCLRTPRDVCHEYVAAVNDLLARCGALYTYDVALDDDEIGCDYVGSVSDAGSILNDCIPWTETVACEDLVYDLDGTIVLDDDCSASAFQGRDR